MTELRDTFHFSYEIAQLKRLIEANVDPHILKWMDAKLDKITGESSYKELYLTYSLLASKLSADKKPEYAEINNLTHYLRNHNANQLETGRLYLLVNVLEAKGDFFATPVLNIIQIADKEELITFLKYLILLPGAGRFKASTVEALRTNITTVFDAIAMNNPYPRLYFNQQQWNQMYLKAVFLQRRLEDIPGVDEMANKELARIISDYAHERWAASRTIDPYFWRPVSNFLEGVLLEDMKRLLKSSNPSEQAAGALCCFNSDKKEAKELLAKYPALQDKLMKNDISWETINSEHGR